jgi:hypothetical protein
MSAGFPPGFGPPAGAPPGFAPAGAPPGYAQQPAQPGGGVDFVLDIPPDPNWQPIEMSDVLDNDGFYQVLITNEKADTDDAGKFRVIMTLEIQDPDAKGKKIARFMQDPRQTKGDTWWQWRMLMRAIWGSIPGGQQGIQYRPGIFKGKIAYVKTQAYIGDRGDQRTGVGSWSTADEWTEAYSRGAHRWPAKVRTAQAPGVGVLPGGSGGLPGAPSTGLPGVAAMPALPGAPLAPGVPAPGAAPMQQAPQNPFAAPPAPVVAAPPAPAPQQNPFGAPPPPPQAPPPAGGFAPPAFAPPAAPGFAPPPPPAPIPFPPQAPGANGIPQPTAAGVAMNFPGTGPQPPR